MFPPPTNRAKGGQSPSTAQCAVPPQRSAGCAARSVTRRRVSASIDAGSASCRSTASAAWSAPSGSQGSVSEKPACAASAAQGSGVPILLLTAMNETENRIAGFECGADDYLPKPFEPRELVLRINAILRRVPPPPSAVPQPSKVVFGEFCFDLEREELTRAGNFVRLTTAEASLLKALARRAGEPITRDDLGEESLASGHEIGRAHV